MRERVRAWIPKPGVFRVPGQPTTLHRLPGPAPSLSSPHGSRVTCAAYNPGEPVSTVSFTSLRPHPHQEQVAPHLTSRSSVIPQFLSWTGTALVTLRTSQWHRRPHHLPGKSWLISSISSTISYGTPASASSTLSWPGIRPATG